ncbi:hypothetical protein [Celeribacter neptunius]|nr:hypothetical protein [Celeribacter neptunius]
MFAGPVLTGESLCGRRDAAAILAEIAGEWDSALSVQVEAETISTLREIEGDWALIEADGSFLNAFLDELIGVPVQLAPTETGYDVDQVDDLLATTEAAWIADALSETRCGPEDLPQLRAGFLAGAGLSGDVTLIPYFTDRVLMLFRIDYPGDWGHSEVIGTGYLTPATGTGTSAE